MSSDYNIYELLDLLSKDNLQVTINSSDAAEKLSFSLLRMLKEIEEDSSVVPSFLSKGILYVIKFFQQFFSQLSGTSECSPNIFASFEDILEILNNIADTGIQTKCTVVLQFGEDLIHYINNQFLPFHFRLKIVKYTNLLFEKCPTYVKDCLYAKPSYKKKLKNALKLISSIGDYEFQVCIIEFVFRAVSKQKRVEALNALCPPEILASILAIKDETFEVDCRRVLNTFNSQNGTHQSVFSIPCLEVTLGNLQLQKPKDDDYKEFWIDFNTGSKRISFYCSQIIDNEDPETDEDIWESICILKDYVQEISSNDDDEEVLAVQLKFLPLSIELISGVTLEKFSFIKLLFKDKDAVMKAIQEIFCTQKCSIAKNQICIKEQEKSFFQPKTLPHSAVAEQEELDTTIPEAALSIGSSQQSATRRKSSVPSEIMSSQYSNNSRHYEVGAVKICRQAEISEILNHGYNPKNPDSTQKSKSKSNYETVKQKQERTYKNPPLQNHDKKEQKKEPVSSPSKPTAGQPHNQLKSAKNKNSVPNPYVPDLSNLEESMSKIPKTGKDQAFQKKKQSIPENSAIVKKKSVFDYSSAEEVGDEAIPPTFEISSASKDFIKRKKLTSPPIQDSKTSNYEQNKTQSTTKNSDNTSSNMNPSVKSNQTKSRKPSPVETKQTESAKEELKKKGENKSPPNLKINPQEKEDKSLDKTQFEKVVIDDKPNELKKLSKDLIPSPNHNISSNKESSLIDKESFHIPKEQKSILSNSVSTKRINSDMIISSQINNSEANTSASRKGRRLRSFDSIDLLPQNYPLPKDCKRSTGTDKKLGTSKKKNRSTPNLTTKLLEEDKVVSIKETQPEATKMDEVTLIPDSLPQQNDISKPEEDQPKQKLTAPAKFSSKKKLAVDSGISSSNNSPACVNDVPSTTSKKRSSSPTQKTQRNISSTKQTISQSSYDKKPLPKTSGKMTNEIEKIEKKLDPKQDKDNNQKQNNKPIAKDKEESSYKFAGHDTSPIITESQVSCFAPITQDNLSKFNKEGQKNLAKQLDERIEEFVKASCQNISDGSNGSPFEDSTTETRKEIQPVSFKKNSKKTIQDSTHDQTDRDKNEQPFAEDDPLPSQHSQIPPKSPSVIINIEEEPFQDESHNAFSIEKKLPSEHKANNNEVLYQAIKLGSVSALSKDPNLFNIKSNQIDVECQEQTGNLTVSPVKKKQAPASSRKYQPLIIRSKSLDSEKPSTGGKESRKTDKTISSPSEKLFTITPPKRRSLNLPLKRNQAAAKINEKKKGYDPYDFDSGSSCEENIQPVATCPRTSMANLSTPAKKKQNFFNRQNSAPQLQTPKEKKKLQAKQPKADPEENSYKFEKQSEKNIAKNVKTSPTSIPDSDCDSPQPKKRSKAKMAKSKCTTNNTLPSADLSKTNPVRSSFRKRKDIDYKETSSVGSSISSFSEPVVQLQEKKKKVAPVTQNQNSPPKNMAINVNNREYEAKITSKMSVSDTSESLYNTSHTQQSEMSWLNTQKSKSPKIHVEKTYSIKKQISYYGSYACIPKRKHSSPKGQTKNKTKKNKEPLLKEQSPQNISHNASFMSNDQIDYGSSPKPLVINKPKSPKSNFSSNNDKGSHRFSLTGSDWQITKKKKPKKAFIKEPFFVDSIEIQRADSFVMFPEDSRPNILVTESILQESIGRPMSSFGSKSNFSDLEITLSSTEDPKLLLPTQGTNSSIQSLNDEPLTSNELKLMLTPSPYLSIDDLKSNSDKPDLDTNNASKVKLGPKEAKVSFKCTSPGEISHSTPVKEDNIELSPLSSTGGDYKSKCFRKSLFSKRKSDISDEDRTSPLLSPIDASTFLFHRRSLKKVEYNSKVKFCSSPLSDSDKSENMASNDDDSSSDDSSQNESSRNDVRSYDFLLHSDKLPHHQTTPSLVYNNDGNIKTLIESFTEDIKKSFQTKQSQISIAVEEVLKGTQKALNKICEKDVHKRSDVHHEFNKKIQQVMNDLESSTSLYKEQKKKVLNDFQEQIKELQKLKDVQQKGLEKLKMINSLYHEALSSEGRSNQAQQKVQNVMKSQMQKLQNKLLDQARQQEMQQVKNQLRKMLH